jgi:DNA-binding MarR family transcriptional regulator
MGRAADGIDRMIDAWQRELPGLDPSALEVVGRVIVLAQYLEKSVNAALKVHKLSLGQFDILATLRRQGPAGGLTPKQLLGSVMLTSGGMTARLTKLEEAGLIVRRPDPADRRGVVVELTAKGRKLIDAAAATRFTEAAESLPPLSEADMRTLARLLRGWLLKMTRPHSADSHSSP